MPDETRPVPLHYEADPLLPHARPWTVAFYSYRGGVGRTTLLVNMARQLWAASYSNNEFCDRERYSVDIGTTRKGRGDVRGLDNRRICLLDMDLEAPGLDAFDLLKPPHESQPGIVEMISEYRSVGVCPPLTKYVYKRELAPAQSDRETGITAYVIRAGAVQSQEYRKFLATMNWNQFYQQEDGYLFFENLRAGIASELGCGILLVDSRTGLTEVGSVVSGHLADSVVIVYQATHAHTNGLVTFTDAVQRRECREGRPVPRLYVASKMNFPLRGTPHPTEAVLADNIVWACEGTRASPVIASARRGDSDAARATGLFSLERLEERAASLDGPHFVPPYCVGPVHVPMLEKAANPQVPDEFLVASEEPADAIGRWIWITRGMAFWDLGFQLAWNPLWGEKEWAADWDRTEDTSADGWETEESDDGPVDPDDDR